MAVVRRLWESVQVAVAETLVWRTAAVLERLNLAALSETQDSQSAVSTATDMPVQILLAAVSDLAASVRWGGLILAESTLCAIHCWQGFPASKLLSDESLHRRACPASAPDTLSLSLSLSLSVSLSLSLYSCLRAH